MDVFIILQRSTSVRLRKRFSGENKTKKNKKNDNVTKNASKLNILIFLTLLSADVKSAVPLRIPLLRNFLLPHFVKWRCFLHEQLDIFLRREKSSVISKCQYFCLLAIQK